MKLENITKFTGKGYEREELKTFLKECTVNYKKSMTSDTSMNILCYILRNGRLDVKEEERHVVLGLLTMEMQKAENQETLELLTSKLKVIEGCYIDTPFRESKERYAVEILRDYAEKKIEILAREKDEVTQVRAEGIYDRGMRYISYLFFLTKKGKTNKVLISNKIGG